ncbi:MAG: hypothetical protein KGZ94_01690 [Clostridia bacterium]|jgi:hypothetical protein|nr:hypothetical protein [Clostridia bacterium]
MLVSFIAPVVIIVIIALILLLIVGIKFNTEREGGEDVIKNVYIYLVLFATLMMTIGGSVAAFMAVADIVAPAPYYQTFDEFQRWGVPEKPPGEGTDEPELSQEELRARYDALVEAEKERQVSMAKNNLIKSFGWIIIPFPIFLYFQRRLVKKEEGI